MSNINNYYYSVVSGLAERDKMLLYIFEDYHKRLTLISNSYNNESDENNLMTEVRKTYLSNFKPHKNSLKFYQKSYK